jgi:hypothetical protein
MFCFLEKIFIVATNIFGNFHIFSVNLKQIAKIEKTKKLKNNTISNPVQSK